MNSPWRGEAIDLEMGQRRKVGLQLALAMAESALSEAKVVLVPTETVYGLAASIRLSQALDKIFRIKDRPTDVPLPILVGEVRQVFELAPEMTDLERKRVFRLAEAFWPGPLTMVLGGGGMLADAVGSRDGGIGFRISSNPFTRVLSSLIPIACTSANLHGHAPSSSCDGALEALGLEGWLRGEGPTSSGELSLVISDDEVDQFKRSGVSSTVVDLRGTQLELLRVGDLGREALEEALMPT